MRTSDRTDRIAVVGAGAAGLAAAMALRAQGRDVVLIERGHAVGGRIRAVPVAGEPDAPSVDGGPTVFTMRWVFDQLFDGLGTDLTTEATLEPLNTLARHAFAASPDAAPFDLFAELDRSADAIGAFAGPTDAAGYRAFVARGRAMYDHLESRFIAAQKPGPAALMGRLGLGPLLHMLRLSPPVPLWRALGAHFKDDRLRQLFGRYATYCGSSPFLAPSTLMLVAHVERSGVWRVRSGMSAIPKAMARVAQRAGVEIRLGADVARIEVADGRARGVILEDGDRIAADAVVFAGDPSALGAGLLGEPSRTAAHAVPQGGRSLSALVWTAEARASGYPLRHHTVFFSSDYPREFREIFAERRMPTEPTVYVCAQDRGDAASAATDQPERLQILVNAPADGDRTGGERGALSEEELDACGRRTRAHLARLGLDLSFGDGTAAWRARRTGPADFHRLAPGTGGAIYGPANHALLATFRRPGARTIIPGLYLASGAAHPGPGAPMAALSGSLAAQAIAADCASATRPRRAAISGGMSTA